MSEVRGKTWIDMTDLSAWKGHMTGIQRVVYNVALHYYKNHENVGYFVYEEHSGNFYDFNFAELISTIESQPSTNGSSQLSESRAKKLFHAIRNQVPNTVRSKIGPQWKERAKRVYIKGRKTYISSREILAKAQKPSVPISKKITFANNDTVLILGNSWDRETIIPDIRKVKLNTNFKLYQLIYDLIPIYEPQSFNQELFEKYSRHMFEVVDVSDGLLAISESSKRDLLRFCAEVRLPEPKVKVIRLGDEIEVTSQPERPVQVEEHIDFILCVGTIEARKNHAILYYTWKLAKQKGVKLPKLVVVGRPGWYTGDLLHFTSLDPVTRNDFIILQDVNDKQLTWLYQNCLFTVYPSMYEGWGLPIAESLAYGKVCVSSNTSSMTEIAGNLLEYFSPYSADECLALLEKYTNEQSRRIKEEEVKERYNITMWAQTAKQVVRLTDKMDRGE